MFWSGSRSSLNSLLVPILGKLTFVTQGHVQVGLVQADIPRRLGSGKKNTTRSTLAAMAGLHARLPPRAEGVRSRRMTGSTMLLEVTPALLCVGQQLSRGPTATVQVKA